MYGQCHLDQFQTNLTIIILPQNLKKSVSSCVIVLVFPWQLNRNYSEAAGSQKP